MIRNVCLFTSIIEKFYVNRFWYTSCLFIYMGTRKTPIIVIFSPNEWSAVSKTQKTKNIQIVATLLLFGLWTDVAIGNHADPLNWSINLHYLSIWYLPAQFYLLLMYLLKTKPTILHQNNQIPIMVWSLGLSLTII